MKRSKSILPWLGVILIGLGSFMAISNPSQEAYEDFAAEQLTLYLKQKICPEVGSSLGSFLESQCKNIVDASTPQIETLIADNTQKHNYIFFSIYETDLSLSSLLPSYHFESVGLFYNFLIYQAEEVK